MEISSENFWCREHLQTVNISQKLPVLAAKAENHDSKYPLYLLLPVIAVVVLSSTHFSVQHYRPRLLPQVVMHQG
jgi:hypothetical protein